MNTPTTETPTMRQYHRAKAECPPGTILLFRLGDFYEIFEGDALEAAPLLGVSCVQRNGVPMCGVPYHAAEVYVWKLNKAGRRVALCDQIEAPRTAAGVVRREITATFPAMGTRPAEVEGRAMTAATIERLPGTRRRHEDGFLWIEGATYPHRATLRAHGFRWNDLRRAWYAPEPEGKGPPPPHAVTAGPYAGILRHLAHEVKAGSGFEEAARRLAPLVPPRALLVPMPGRTGGPGALAVLAAEVAKRARGVDVLDALRSNRHASRYERKKRKEEPEPVIMRTIAPIPEGRPVWILDNVIDTGTTARAALRAIPGATLLALASTSNTPENWRAEAGRLF